MGTEGEVQGQFLYLGMSPNRLEIRGSAIRLKDIADGNQTFTVVGQARTYANASDASRRCVIDNGAL